MQYASYALIFGWRNQSNVMCLCVTMETPLGRNDKRNVRKGTDQRMTDEKKTAGILSNTLIENNSYAALYIQTNLTELI